MNKFFYLYKRPKLNPQYKQIHNNWADWYSIKDQAFFFLRKIKKTYAQMQPSQNSTRQEDKKELEEIKIGRWKELHPNNHDEHKCKNPQ